MKPRNKFRGYYVVRANGTISKNAVGMTDIITAGSTHGKIKPQQTKNAIGMTDIVTVGFNLRKTDKHNQTKMP